MSRPLRFAFKKISPTHRIKLKVKVNARPLSANEAIRGSPSPRNVLNIIPTQATESVKRLHASSADSVVVIAAQRTTSYRLFGR